MNTFTYLFFIIFCKNTLSLDTYNLTSFGDIYLYTHNVKACKTFMPGEDIYVSVNTNILK